MQPYMEGSSVFGVGDDVPPYSLGNGTSGFQTITDVELTR